MQEVRLPVVLASQRERVVEQSLHLDIGNRCDGVGHRLAEAPQRSDDALAVFEGPAVAHGDPDHWVAESRKTHTESTDRTGRSLDLYAVGVILLNQKLRDRQTLP